MTKRITVTIVRVQTTELTVPDDFDLTAEGLAKVKGATKHLANRAEADSVVDSMMFELLPEEDQPIAEKWEGIHETVDCSSSSRTQAFLFAIQTMYVVLLKLAPSKMAETAMTQLYGLDIEQINASIQEGNKPKTRGLAERFFNEWVKRTRDRNLHVFWADGGDTFVVCSDDVLTDVFDGIEA